MFLEQGMSGMMLRIVSWNISEAEETSEFKHL